MSALEEYGYDITELAQQGKIEPVAGRDSEVGLLMTILTKRTRKNPLLVGISNIDKFCIVEELARRIVNGNAFVQLLGKKIIAIDLGKLLSGTKFRGDFEERVQAILQEVYQSNWTVIPYFDELWTGIANGGLDIGAMLKFPLAAGRAQCIAATVPEHLDYFRGSGLLARQFRVISIREVG